MSNSIAKTQRHGNTSRSEGRGITQSLNTCHPERHRATQERGKVEGPRASVLYHAASGSSHETKVKIRQWLRRGWHLISATLREIFDESTYDRFLQRTQRHRSVESYRVFMVERDAAAATKPRCC
jgi:hypothetical protein